MPRRGAQQPGAPGEIGVEGDDTAARQERDHTLLDPDPINIMLGELGDDFGQIDGADDGTIKQRRDSCRARLVAEKTQDRRGIKDVLFKFRLASSVRD